MDDIKQELMDLEGRRDALVPSINQLKQQRLEERGCLKAYNKAYRQADSLFSKKFDAAMQENVLDSESKIKGLNQQIHYLEMQLQSIEKELAWLRKENNLNLFGV